MIGEQEQTYGFIRAGFFNDHLFLTGGVSRTWAQVNDYSIGGMTLADGTFVGSTRPTTDATLGNTGSALEPSVKGYHDTYQAGALYKILPDLSAYYSFSSNAQIAQGTPIWEAGKQDEFGLKADLFDNRLSVTADHFQITESNLSFTNPLFNTGQSTVPLIFADENSHGYEANVVGGITSDLSVIASYTNQHLRDSFGRRLRDIPDNMANLLLNYHFHQGFLNKADVFVGVLHQGNTAGETVSGFTSLGVPEQPGFYVAQYTVVNAGAGYHWHHYGVHLNVDNALNKQFWWQASSRTSLVPYPGANLRLTFTVHL